MITDERLAYLDAEYDVGSPTGELIGEVRDLQQKLSYCAVDSKNVQREMTDHLGRPFTSHATDAVLILLYQTQRLQSILAEGLNLIEELRQGQNESMTTKAVDYLSKICFRNEDIGLSRKAGKPGTNWEVLKK